MKVRNNKFIIIFVLLLQQEASFLSNEMLCVENWSHNDTRQLNCENMPKQTHLLWHSSDAHEFSLVLLMIVVESWNIYGTFASFIASLNDWENSENCFSSTMMFNAMMCKISSICLHAHKLRKDLCFSLVRIVGEKQKQIKFYVIANDNYVNFLPLYFFIESVSLCTPLTTEKIEKFPFHPRHDESDESSRWLVFIRQQSGSSMRWQHCDSKS